MKQKNNLKIALEWIKIGENELKFAKKAFENLRAFYPQICFQCQQAVEKHLKGFLIYHSKKFPKIHDLTELIKKIRGDARGEGSGLSQKAKTRVQLSLLNCQ